MSESSVYERKEIHHTRDMSGGGWKEVIAELLKEEVARRGQSGSTERGIPVTFLLGANDEPDSTVVTILDNDEAAPAPGEPPTGRLHHPKHEFKYPQNHPLVREFHLFTASSDDDFPVFKTELALRKRFKSGRCTWWDGGRFVAGSCSSLRWSERLFKKVAPDFFEYRIQELPLSVGKSSGVRDYKLWSRAWDEAGQDSLLLVGRNVSRFDVIKRCRYPNNAKKCKPERPTQ